MHDAVCATELTVLTNDKSHTVTYHLQIRSIIKLQCCDLLLSVCLSICPTVTLFLLNLFHRFCIRVRVMNLARLRLKERVIGQDQGLSLRLSTGGP